MRIDGKIALITGASTYMGPAFTRVFTDAGAIVCLQDKDRTAATPHSDYARSNPGGGVVFEADLTDPATFPGLLAEIEGAAGK